MSIIDEVVVNAKSAAATVGKKATEFVDISKLRINSSELNSEITKRYEALGRIVYDSKKEETDIDGLITECIKSIDALYERLDENGQQIAKLTKKVICKNCGNTNGNDAVFCSRCGSKFSGKE